jgi:hypothetical protein
MCEWTGTVRDGLVRLWDVDFNAVTDVLEASYITVDSQDEPKRELAHVVWRDQQPTA